MSWPSVTVAAILPVLDDFERAIADKSEDPTKRMVKRVSCQLMQMSVTK